ncbi:MAG TPA: carboxypeptidase-like regulatory domain-containing protein, partial [Pyrinomonadaceae bacterium]
MPKLIPLTRRHARCALTLLCTLLCALALPSAARARQQQQQAPATVAGRVTEGERPATGVVVTLISSAQGQGRYQLAARVKTDADGRYVMTNVAPGRYQVLPVAPAYVVEGLGGFNFPPGRTLNVNPGEEVKDIDFKVEPGGVITGRVTDADGQPVIAELVTVMPVDERPGMPRLNADSRDQMTDDRGVYRIFGLPPGRYRVAVGRAAESGALSYGRRRLFRRTFYPDAADASDARVVEVSQGIEATDIDITVGRPLKTYKVSGRFVTADTNEPVAGVAVGYGTLSARGQNAGGYFSGTTTNERGEFVTDGLAPGRYLVYPVNNAMPGQAVTDFYSEGTPFDVGETDVSGLVVKVKRGVSVSGVVAVEGVSDRAAAAQMLSNLRVYAYVDMGRQQTGTPGTTRPVGVNPDGTFRIAGLRPGKLRVGAIN